MPTVQECETALRVLAGRLNEIEPSSRSRHAVDRTLSCHVIDLETYFSGRVDNGELVDLRKQADPDAQIRITLTSADLLALIEGRLNLTTAWATGRVRIDASVLDLLKLRSLL